MGGLPNSKIKQKITIPKVIQVYALATYHSDEMLKKNWEINAGRDPKSPKRGFDTEIRFPGCCRQHHKAKLATWLEQMVRWRPWADKGNAGRRATRWTDELKLITTYWIRSSQNREEWKIVEEAYVKQWTSRGWSLLMMMSMMIARWSEGIQIALAYLSILLAGIHSDGFWRVYHNAVVVHLVETRHHLLILLLCWAGKIFSKCYLLS